jgi:hypothetical protein
VYHRLFRSQKVPDHNNEIWLFCMHPINNLNSFKN